MINLKVGDKIVTKNNIGYRGVGVYLGRQKFGEYKHGLRVRFPIHKKTGDYAILHPKEPIILVKNLCKFCKRNERHNQHNACFSCLKAMEFERDMSRPTR